MQPLLNPKDATGMYELTISTLAFHALATLALLAVSAATALRNPLRRRGPSMNCVTAAQPTLVASIHHAAELQEEQAEAA
jgi:hypothetical protein